jgi:hypothetical protein
VDGDSSAIRLLTTHLMALVPDEIADIGKLAAQLLPRAERVRVEPVAEEAAEAISADATTTA